MVWPRNSEHRRQKNVNTVYPLPGSLIILLRCNSEKGKEQTVAITNLLNRAQFMYEAVKTQHL